MNNTAYLIVTLNTAESPPIVYHVGVYSERHPTANLRDTVQLELLQHSARDFATAQQYVLQVLANDHYKWTWPLLSDSARARVMELRTQQQEGMSK